MRVPRIGTAAAIMLAGVPVKTGLPGSGVVESDAQAGRSDVLDVEAR